MLYSNLGHIFAWKTKLYKKAEDYITQLTQKSKILLEKLIVAQPAKQLSSNY
jgi:hypothetical protein